MGLLSLGSNQAHGYGVHDTFPPENINNTVIFEAETMSKIEKQEEATAEEDDIVCLDQSFFINDDYQLSTFTFGSQVLQLYCLQSASTDFDLTGQLVWPGAMILNKYLSENTELLKGLSIIELGSGVGITGILCRRFCKEVVLTDHNEEILKILEKNIQLHTSSENPNGLEVKKLEWGQFGDIHQILQDYPEGFDLLLGADIYYSSFQQNSIGPLFSTVLQLLHAGSGRNCKFVLAYVSRAKTMDMMILNKAAQFGMQMNEIMGTRSVVGNLGGVIYEITLPSKQ